MRSTFYRNALESKSDTFQATSLLSSSLLERHLFRITKSAVTTAVVISPSENVIEKVGEEKNEGRMFKHIIGSWISG